MAHFEVILTNGEDTRCFHVEAEDEFQATIRAEGEWFEEFGDYDVGVDNIENEDDYHRT